MPSATQQPKVTGVYIQSEMLRVDRDFAQAVREAAKQSDSTVTEITRIMYLDTLFDILEKGAPASKPPVSKSKDRQPASKKALATKEDRDARAHVIRV